MKANSVSIWYIIGLQLSIYGLLIGGAGIWQYFNPPAPEQQTVLFELHPGIWGGIFMFIVGVIYTVKFRKTSEIHAKS